MKRRSIIATLAALVLCGPVAWAGGLATPDEAKAMAIKAAEYLKANGPEQALPEFSSKDGPWHDRDLYVTVTDANGVMVANGVNPGLIGRSLIDLKDVDGKPFTRETVAVVDAGWVNFKWRNPVTNAIELKTKYNVRVGQYVVGVGAYAQ